MIKFYSYSCPVPLRSLCCPQKQVSESRDMQSAETQLVSGISCMARKAGYLAKMLSDKGLCVTLIADSYTRQPQNWLKRGCHCQDSYGTTPKYDDVSWRVTNCVLGSYVNRVPPKGSTRFAEVAGVQGVARQGVVHKTTRRVVCAALVFGACFLIVLLIL